MGKFDSRTLLEILVDYYRRKAYKIVLGYWNLVVEARDVRRVEGIELGMVSNIDSGDIEFDSNDGSVTFDEMICGAE